MSTAIDAINRLLWENVLVYGLLAVGIYFTLRLRALQVLHFGELFRVIRGSKQPDTAGISPFQALTVSLASRVGTGNLTGVAIALSLGGPGAIFWMWVVALMGMSTAYAESTLAQLYKVKDDAGQFRGGPAVYIARGLKAPWAAAVFSVCLIVSFGLVFNAVQANAIADAVHGAFGLPRPAVGIALAALAGAVIFGGLGQIARVAEVMVPFMAGAYLLAAIYVLITNFAAVPGILLTIVAKAFGLRQALGGVAGSVSAALLHGVKRGMFSNEAGMGSAPNIAACATPDPHHPSSQGFVQALGVFIDTPLVCSATAVMILLSGVLDPASGVTGTQLTQAALTVHLGAAGKYFLAVAVFFFAFTSIIGNYTYAENAVVFLGRGQTRGLIVLRVLALAMVLWGAQQSVTTVFAAADASMGLMATINLVAILLLSPTVVKLTRDYLGQRRAGHAPRFRAGDYPELGEGIDHAIWR
ncbi:MAG: alanine:cation symporter family protein [Proteobacteria bacterium]|nr:alanine:cation symporter family protein [Pseudomonadota bacterium]